MLKQMSYIKEGAEIMIDKADLSDNVSIKISINEFASAYYNSIYLFCLGRLGNNEQDAYEVTNNVFLVLCLKWESIDKHNIEGWLYKTAKNKIYEYRRENYKHLSNLSDIDDFEDCLDISYNIESTVSEDDIEKYKTDILNSLKQEERELFNCYYIQKKNYGELTNIYHINEGALRTRITRINKKIRNIIKNVIYLCILLLNIIL